MSGAVVSSGCAMLYHKYALIVVILSIAKRP